MQGWGKERGRRWGKWEGGEGVAEEWRAYWRSTSALRGRSECTWGWGGGWGMWDRGKGGRKVVADQLQEYVRPSGEKRV